MMGDNLNLRVNINFTTVTNILTGVKVDLDGQAGKDATRVLYDWADEGDTMLFVISHPTGIKEMLDIYPHLANKERVHTHGS